MLPQMHVRVVVEHSPTFYEVLGLMAPADCPAVLEIPGYGTTFYRTASTPRWVLYKKAIQGHGEPLPLHRNQR